MKKTTLCYLEHNDCYLMMFRNKKKNDQSGGKWLGIGGKFLEEETPEECLRREVMEETGFTLNSLHFHGVVHFLSDTWNDEDMYLYTSRDFSWPQQDSCAKFDAEKNAGTDASESADKYFDGCIDGRSTTSIDSPCCRDKGAGNPESLCSAVREAEKKSLSSLTSEPPTPDCNEGTLSWIPKSQVLSLNLWEGDHLFLERLIANEDFGELTVRYEGDILVSAE